MSKFLLNLLVQISKALIYSKIQFLFEKEFSSDFGPSGPAPPTLTYYAPQAVGSPLGPLSPSRVGVFAERRIPFDFAHSGRDAFSLSCHCHVGPTYRLHPLPHAGRPLLLLLIASGHPTPHGLQPRDAGSLWLVIIPKSKDRFMEQPPMKIVQP
jgi:hypothetical protein